nr:MAG TPA: hypothetical protein [Caudoviricetes sp.]
MISIYVFLHSFYGCFPSSAIKEFTLAVDGFRYLVSSIGSLFCHKNNLLGLNLGILNKP